MGKREIKFKRNNNPYLKGIRTVALTMFLVCSYVLIFYIAEGITGFDLDILLYIGIVSITLFTTLKSQYYDTTIKHENIEKLNEKEAEH